MRGISMRLLRERLGRFTTRWQPRLRNERPNVPRRGQRIRSENVSAPAQHLDRALAIRWWRYRHHFLEAKRIEIETRRAAR